MKLKLFFDKKMVKPCSELVLISPLVKDLFVNETRFKEALKHGEQYVEYSTIEECDFIVLPYKWNLNPTYTNELIIKSKEHNKKILIFHIDDSDEQINVENSYVFRTSFYKSKQKSYERAFPCFKDDNFKFKYLENPELTVAFCGQVMTPIRKTTIDLLNSSKIKTNFIIRNVAWPSIEFNKTKEVVQWEFYENITSNIFNLCIRGGGNFSYRLYETLMMGRIPIVIDTDISLPYENVIDWNNHAVIVKDLNNLVVDIENFYEKTNINQIQINNRKFWEDFLSPLGVIKNLHKTI